MAAGHTLPVVRAQMVIASALAAGLEGVVRMTWTPAAIAMPAAFFRRAVDDWISGGPFPALALVAYTREATGALVTDGLSYFTGQELRLEPALVDDPVAATRLAARLVNHMVAALPLTSPQDFSGMSGEALRLEPNGAIVQVHKA